MEIQLDFITSIGSKNLLTAQAEAQARTGGPGQVAVNAWTRTPCWLAGSLS